MVTAREAGEGKAGLWRRRTESENEEGERAATIIVPSPVSCRCRSMMLYLLSYPRTSYSPAQSTLEVYKFSLPRKRY